MDRTAVRGVTGWRLRALRFFFMLLVTVVGVRLFMLQVVDAAYWRSVAENQHTLREVLVPTRGSVYVKDFGEDMEYAVATNEPRAAIEADPRLITDPVHVGLAIAKILQLEGWDTYGVVQPVVEGAPPEEDVGPTETERLIERLSKSNDPWEPVAQDVHQDQLDEILALEQEGIYYVLKDTRTYPEDNFGGHVLGFLGKNKDGLHEGYYGIEGYYDEFLAGHAGSLYAQGDATGRWIGVGARSLTPAIDGGNILLTIDRTVQYMACKMLREGVAEFQADSGSLVILEPATGRVLAMCGAPDYDPDEYGNVENGSVYNNSAIFQAYESGSVMKAFTMAAAIDRGLVSPYTTFDDPGSVEVDDYTIKNSDLKAHGVVSMTTALDESLNTAMVWLMRTMGRDVLKEYLINFGFGQLSGIELATEAPGTLAALDKSAEVYAATASFGQGITVTPLQIAAAYGALANGGALMQPYIVEELRHADGTIETHAPKKIRQVISPKTATTVSGMLVSVVENGHGKKAGVPGYYIAGKTGTAQVAEAGGYSADKTIGSFAGFGPVGNPKFVMVVKLENPKTVEWAESSAAPVFGRVADFLLRYYDVPPERE